MSSMVIWMLGIGASVAALVLAAAMRLPYLHLGVAALVSLLVALASFQEAREIKGGRQEAGMLASSSFRHIGLIWTWAALAMFVTYAFILQWREWWHYFIAFMVLAGLCLFVSSTLRKDAEADSADATMFSIGRILAIALLVVCIGVMAGLLIHDGRAWVIGGKFLKLPGAAKIVTGAQEWAANNIFFFGALAIAAVSWNALGALGRVRK